MNQQPSSQWASLFSLVLFTKGLADGRVGMRPLMEESCELCFLMNSLRSQTRQENGGIHTTEDLLMTKTYLNSPLLGCQSHECIHSIQT